MFDKMKRMKWILSTPWIDRDWAQRDYDALNLDPDIDVITYGYAPMIGDNGERLGFVILFTVKSTMEKFERVKEALKETHREENYMGLPIFKCAANVKRIEPV